MLAAAFEKRQISDYPLVESVIIRRF